APPSPDYVPDPEHADDEIVVEEQPYAEDASPNAQSPEMMTTRTQRRILLIILPMEEMTAMTSRGHQKMMRMMIWTLRLMRRRSTQLLPTLRQTVILEMLREDHRRSTKIIELRTALQGHVIALQGQVTA
nr:hypothetical protein [Tanacetum cinerariifolium]